MSKNTHIPMPIKENMLPAKLDLTQIAGPGNGIVGTYISIDSDFERSSNRRFIQELLEHDGVSLKDALYTVLPQGGKLNGYPSCPCGYTKFGINQIADTTVKCVKCHQPVTDPAEGTLDTMLWLHRPVGIKRFINPKIFIDLQSLTTETQYRNFDPWRFLTDPSYKPTPTGLESSLYLKMETWISDGVQRGYNYFALNLRELITRVLDEIPNHVKKVKPDWHGKKRDMLSILKYPDSHLFCEVLPVLNQLILQIEKVGETFFKADTTELYGKAITTVIGLPYREGSVEETPKLLRTADKEVAKMAWLMADFYIQSVKIEGQKPGVIKSDIYGQRGDFTYRGVVTSIQGPHHGDESHIPWAFGVVLLTPFLMPRLRKLGFSLPEYSAFIEEHTLTYHPILDQLMNEDIIPNFKRGVALGPASKGPDGIPSYTIRYPFLEVHSGQLLTITKVKTDPNDRSISISALGQPGWRGDHDGDEFSANIIRDKYIYETLLASHISANTMDLNTPYGYGRATELPDPVIQSWVGFVTLHNGRK